MPWREHVQSVLLSFFRLLTQPFEQTPEDSVKGAVTAIALGEAFAAIGETDMLGAARGSLSLVAVWMVVSAVVTEPERRRLEVARNIGVISFWIAATLALALLAELFYSSPMDRAPRLEFVWAGLLLLVPIHMFRNLRVPTAVVMTLALWVSTGFFARWLLY